MNQAVPEIDADRRRDGSATYVGIPRSLTFTCAVTMAAAKSLVGADSAFPLLFLLLSAQRRRWAVPGPAVISWRQHADQL